MTLTALRMPKPIRPGDTIGVAAPSMPIKPREKGAITEHLQEAGYRVKLGRTIECLMNAHGYLAGDARARAQDINELFADPEVDAIICARGGYGSSHTMNYLDLKCIRENPKVFVGFSDITNFHSVLNKYCDLVTFHGPMVLSNMVRGFDAYSRNSLHQALNMTAGFEFHNPPDDPMTVICPGTAEGMITGGNLSVLAHSVGTFYQPDTAGKILFLEDVDESVPRLDMMITQLENAGMMDRIHGLLLGNFSDCSNEKYDGSYRIPDFLRERFADYPVPVFANLCSGHRRPMGTIPMGTICRMNAAGKKPKVSFSDKVTE